MAKKKNEQGEGENGKGADVEPVSSQEAKIKRSPKENSSDPSHKPHSSPKTTKKKTTMVSSTNISSHSPSGRHRHNDTDMKPEMRSLSPSTPKQQQHPQEVEGKGDLSPGKATTKSQPKSRKSSKAKKEHHQATDGKSNLPPDKATTKSPLKPSTSSKTKKEHHHHHHHHHRPPHRDANSNHEDHDADCSTNKNIPAETEAQHTKKHHNKKGSTASPKPSSLSCSSSSSSDKKIKAHKKSKEKKKTSSLTSKRKSTQQQQPPLMLPRLAHNDVDKQHKNLKEEPAALSLPEFHVVDSLEDGTRLLQRRNPSTTKLPLEKYYGRLYPSTPDPTDGTRAEFHLLGEYGRYLAQDTHGMGQYGRIISRNNTFTSLPRILPDDKKDNKKNKDDDDEEGCYYLHQLRALQQLKPRESVAYQRAQYELYREFEREAQAGARQIVAHFEGQLLPSELTRLSGGVAGGEKFVAGKRIFFKAARLANPDVCQIYEGDHEAAIKSSSREVQFLRALEQVEFRTFSDETKQDDDSVGDNTGSAVLVPLSTLVDWHGFRVCCLSYVPVGSHTRLLEHECRHILDQISTKFGLSDTPADLEVHRLPSTGELVLIDVARLLPLEVGYDEPTQQWQVVSQSAVFRPELMQQLPFTVLHFDSICNHANIAQARKLMGQVQSVLDQHIAEVAQALQAFELTLVDSPVTFANAQGLWQLPLSLAEHLHAAGVNVRHLGKITQLLPKRNDLKPLRFVLEREMMVRAAKVLLRGEMVEMAPKTMHPPPETYDKDIGEQQIRTVVVKFFNRLLGAQRLEFWTSSLLPMVMKKFDYHIGPDSVDQVNLVLLCEELQQATGVSLTFNARRRLRHDQNIFNLSDQVVRQEDVMEIGLRQKQWTVRSLLSALLKEGEGDASGQRGSSSRARLGHVRMLVRQLGEAEWEAQCHVLLSAIITGLSERTPTSLENAWEAVTEVLAVLPSLHPWQVVAQLLQGTLRLATQRPFSAADRVAVRRLLTDPQLQLPGVRRVEALILNAQVFESLDPDWAEAQFRESVDLLLTLAGPRSVLVASLLERISALYQPQQSLERAFAVLTQETTSPAALDEDQCVVLARICSRRAQCAKTNKEECRDWARRGLSYMMRVPLQSLDFAGQSTLTELLHSWGNSIASFDVLVLALQCGQLLWDANAQGMLLPVIASSVKVATQQHRLVDSISSLTALLMVKPALWPQINLAQSLGDEDKRLLGPLVSAASRLDETSSACGILFVRRHLPQLLEFVAGGLRETSLDTVEPSSVPASVHRAVQSVGVARGLSLDLREQPAVSIGTRRGVDIVLAASPLRDLPGVILYSILQLPNDLWESPKFLHALLACCQQAQGLMVFSLSKFRRGCIAVQSLVRAAWSVEAAVDLFEALVNDLFDLVAFSAGIVDDACQELVAAVGRALVQFVSTVTLATATPISITDVYDAVDGLTRLLNTPASPLSSLDDSLVFNIDNNYPTVCQFDNHSQQALLSSTVWTPLHCDMCVKSVLEDGVLLKVYRSALLKNELLGFPFDVNGLPTDSVGVIGALPESPHLVFTSSTCLPLAETPAASLADASVPFDARARDLRAYFENIMISFGHFSVLARGLGEQVRDFAFSDMNLTGEFRRHDSLYDVATDLSENVKVTVKVPEKHMSAVSALLRQYGTIVEESVADDEATLAVKQVSNQEEKEGSVNSNYFADEDEALRAQTTQNLDVLSLVAQVANISEWREACALYGDVVSWRRLWIEVAKANNATILTELKDAESHSLAALEAAAAAGSLQVVEHLLKQETIGSVSADSLLRIIENTLVGDSHQVLKLLMAHLEDRLPSRYELLCLIVAKHANRCLEMIISNGWSPELDSSALEYLVKLALEKDNVKAALELLELRDDVAVGSLLAVALDRSLDQVATILFDRALSGSIDAAEWDTAIAALARSGRADLLTRVDSGLISSWSDLLPAALRAGYVTVAELCFTRAGGHCQVSIPALLQAAVESNDQRCVDVVISHFEISETDVPWAVAVQNSNDSLDVLRHLLSLWDIASVCNAVSLSAVQEELQTVLSNMQDRLCGERARLLAPLFDKQDLLKAAVTGRNEALVDEVLRWPHVKCTKDVGVAALSGRTWNPSIATKAVLHDSLSPHANELYEAARHDVRRLVFLSSCTGWRWTDRNLLHRMAVGPSSSLRWGLNASVVDAEVGSTAADGDTPLHRAAAAGIAANVDLLLHAGASAQSCNCLGMTPAGSALAAGQWKLVAIFTLPERLDFRMPLSESDIPLLMSSIIPLTNEFLTRLLNATVASKLRDAAARLVQAGASLVDAGADDPCALMIAVRGSDIHMLDTLVETAYSSVEETTTALNSVRFNGMPLLHTAISIRAAPVVEWLLRHGVDISVRIENGPGETHMGPTHLAQFSRARTCYQLLVQAGAGDETEDYFYEDSSWLVGNTPSEQGIHPRHFYEHLEELTATVVHNPFDENRKRLWRKNPHMMSKSLQSFLFKQSEREPVDLCDKIRLLFDLGADPCWQDEEQSSLSAFHIAACTLNDESYRSAWRLLLQSTEPLQVDRLVEKKKNWNPLCMASAVGNVVAVSLMIDAGCNVQRNDFEALSLMAASRAMEPCLVKAAPLARKAESETSKKALYDTLAGCANCGMVDALRAFIALPTMDLNREGNKHPVALLAAVTGGQKAAVELLLEHGALPLQFVDKYDESPLFAAIASPNEEIALSLARSVDPDCLRQTPCVSDACKTGHVQLTQLLLDLKCPLRGFERRPAIVRASEVSQSKTDNIARDLVKLLLDAGEDPGVSDDDQTPLSLACLNGFFETVQMLVQNGASVNERYGNRVTPLIVSIHYGHEDVAMWLIRNGADVNQWGGQLQTPLLLACGRGMPNVAKELLAQGANPNMAAIDGSLPIVAAVESRNLDLVSVLCEYGAEIPKDRLLETALMCNLPRERLIAVLPSEHDGRFTVEAPTPSPDDIAFACIQHFEDAHPSLVRQCREAIERHPPGTNIVREVLEGRISLNSQPESEDSDEESGSMPFMNKPNPIVTYCDRLRARRLAAIARELSSESPETAIPLLEEAVSLFPCSEYANEVACICLQAGKVAQALKLIFGGLSADLAHASQSFLLAGRIFADHVGDSSTAAQLFQRAVAADPKNTDARSALDSLGEDVPATRSQLTDSFESIQGMLDSNDELRIASRNARHAAEDLRKEDDKVEELFELLADALNGELGQSWRHHLLSIEQDSEATMGFNLLPTVCSLVRKVGSASGGDSEVKSALRSLGAKLFDGKIHGTIAALAKAKKEDVESLQDTGLSELGLRKSLLLNDNELDVAREWIDSQSGNAMLEYPFVREVLENIQNPIAEAMAEWLMSQMVQQSPAGMDSDEETDNGYEALEELGGGRLVGGDGGGRPDEVHVIEPKNGCCVIL